MPVQETPVKWRKSKRSGDPTIGTCVEVASIDGGRAIRDSKDPDGPWLSLTVGGLRGLIAAVKASQHDL